MTKQDVENLVKLREFIANFYNKLEGADQATSVMQTDEVAGFCLSVARSIDDLIREHVTFQ